MKSNEEIIADMNQFVEEIPSAVHSGSYARVKEVSDRITAYMKENDVPKELNLVVTSGYGEMLYMSLTAFEMEHKNDDYIHQ